MKLVVKVGTSTLAHAGGRLNIRRVELLCKVISDIKNAGNEIIIVSSGAIGMGVGKLGLHKAFRVVHDENGVQIVPIRKIAHVQLDDLIGYEIPKKKLIDNTEAFVNGKKARR